MMVDINTTYKGSTYYGKIEEITECPICKHAIKPVTINNYLYTDDNNNYKLSIHHLCKACNSPFISLYDLYSIDSTRRFSSSNLRYTAPNIFTPITFEEMIVNTSPNFIKIYNQAAAAESYQLDEIAGIGYRKALEFLIKDFLILEHTDKQESIKKSPLGSCITNFIDNNHLKVAASRAVWLGNDQTHYIQKFEDKDINDLKRLIRLTLHWILMLLETKEAEKIEPIK